MSKNKRIIAKIMDGNTIVMTIDQNLISAEFGALDRGSLTTVADWGIYVNRGSLTFIDNTGFFNNSTVNSPEIANYIVKFYLAYRDQENLIAAFKVQSVSDFNEETKEVKIECVSKLEELQRQNQNESYPRPFDEKTTAALLSECFSDLAIVVGADPKGLNATNIYCPYFPKETTWARLNKICQASMCRIFDNEEGIPIISGSYPTKTPIVIAPNNIINIANSGYVSVPNSSIIVTNRTKYIAESDGYLPDVNLYFTINYDEQGEIASVSNSDNFFLETTEATDRKTTRINIQKAANTQYKINSSLIYLAGTITNELYIDNPAAGFTYPGVPQNVYSRDIAIGYSFVNVSDSSEIFIGSGESNIIAFSKIGDGITRVTGVNMRVRGNHFRDNGTETVSDITKPAKDIFEILTNDLIQTKSGLITGDGTKYPLGNHIIDEVKRRYGKGIECFEIECLFNDYYYEDGTKAFDKSDLSNHFKKYDVIIPYVQKRGRTVPLRTNTDGTPKKFRVIGISYLYDGLLRQKLQLQEERYDID